MTLLCIPHHTSDDNDDNRSSCKPDDTTFLCLGFPASNFSPKPDHHLLGFSVRPSKKILHSTTGTDMAKLGTTNTGMEPQIPLPIWNHVFLKVFILIASYSSYTFWASDSKREREVYKSWQTVFTFQLPSLLQACDKDLLKRCDKCRTVNYNLNFS